MTASRQDRPEVTGRDPGPLPAGHTAAAWRSGAAAILLAILATCVVVPFDPGMPGAELDSSWAVALNQAVAQGLAFGRQVVFTFGPYVAVYTRVYHPDTYPVTIVASLLLAASTAAALWLLVVGAVRRLVIAVAVLLLAGTSLPDIQLFLYPVLLALVCLQRGQGDADQVVASPNCVSRPLAAALLALLFVPLGLLPLIKGTLALVSGLIGGGCLAYLAWRRRPGAALLCGTAALTSLLAAWVAAGQSPADLPHSAQTTFEIISGYTDAMALTGSAWQIGLFAVVAVGLLGVAVRQRAEKAPERALLVWTLAVFLFIAFKGGFVRHDAHAMMAAAALPAAALWLGLVLRPSRAWVVWTLAALVAWVGIHRAITPRPDLYLANELRARLVGPAVAWQRARGHAPSNAARFATSWQQIRTAQPLPALDGPVDIYPYDQALLLASGNEWRPRPVPQSYSAYTPQLLEMNRQHLLGARPPQHLLVAVKPTDNRFPALDDSTSWPALLTLYRPHQVVGDFIHLRRVHGAVLGTPRYAGQASRHALGAWISLPPSATPTWAEIDLQPTTAGRMATVLLKSSRLRLTVRLANGSVRSFHFVAAVARGGFMLSPLVTEARDVALLWAPPRWLADRQVVAFMLTTAPTWRWLWQPELTVRVGHIDGLRPVADDAAFALDRQLVDHMEPAPELATTASVDCDATIDRVNGLSPSLQLRASMLLSVSGWLSPAAAQGRLAERSFVTLTAADGRRWLLSTRASNRADVAAHFKQPGLKRCGYDTTVDVTTLAADSSRFTLGLAYSGPEGLVQCTQPAVPLTLGPAGPPAQP